MNLKKKILLIADALEKYYPELGFKNHCYLRIAYDNVLGYNSSNHQSPVLHNISYQRLEEVYNKLFDYSQDKQKLISDNYRSLQIRREKPIEVNLF